VIQHYDFFVIRRPIFPVQHLSRFHQQLSHDSLDTALRDWYADPIAQQALQVASPTLFDRFQRWLTGEKLSEQEKLLITLHKYLVRMTNRCTPYGLFAGCAVGSYGTQTILSPAAQNSVQQHTRLDIECLLTLKEWLVNQPVVRNQLKLYPNSTLYLAGDTYRFIEQQHEQQGRHYFISAFLCAVRSNH
jgi:lantibiotic biosynthesis protein